MIALLHDVPDRYVVGGIEVAIRVGREAVCVNERDVQVVPKTDERAYFGRRKEGGKLVRRSLPSAGKFIM